MSFALWWLLAQALGMLAIAAGLYSTLLSAVEIWILEVAPEKSTLRRGNRTPVL